MMNSKKIFEIAKKNTPSVKINIKNKWFRHDVVKELNGKNNVGIELGVARGIYSRRMVDSAKFKRFYGVDIYGDIHDTKEYISALKYIGIENTKYSLLRMDFDAALLMFEDNYFDFIYVDGFAHAGEEGGKTLINWIKKLKVGGILAGDDYHNDWPLVVWAVNDLAKKLGAEITLTGGSEDEIYCKYPTWYLKKEVLDTPSLNPLLFKLSMREKKRINFYRVGAFAKIRKLLVTMLELLRIKQLIKNLMRKE
jgi:hypothetical protein